MFALPPRFTAKDILPNLFAGFIAGLMTLIASISYATLIFSGPLAPHLNLGIVSALLSATVIGFAVACRSSSPVIISGPDANISAIMALMAASVAAALGVSAPPARLAAHLWIAIALSSLLGGVFLYLLGRFQLGRWIRFIPYPVVGGFLAGTGWLLIRGSFKVMSDTALSIGHLPQLLARPNLIHWLPGLFFAVTLLLVLRFYKHYLIMPSLVVGGIVIVHLALYFSGFSIAAARASGWLLAPLPGDLLLHTWKSLSFADIDWGILASQGANLSALLTVAAIVILLNAASIELATRRDIDLDSELKSNGIANLLAAPFGGLVGCIALSRSLLNYKAGASSRISGMTAALLCGALLLLGTSFLSFLPRPILGGLLLYLGLGLLVEWVYDGWFKFSRFDYILILAILLIIAILGFLPGIGIGLVAACILFAFNYSHINVIKNELSGAAYRSNVERYFRQQKILKEKGDAIYILRLQGYIFFGTAYTLLMHVTGRLANAELKPVQYLILDFSFVSGLDSSSVLSFSKIRQIAEARKVKLLYIHLDPQIRKMLAEGGCLEEADDRNCSVFLDLDHAVEWCEEEILRHEEEAQHARPFSLAEELATEFPRPEMLSRLLSHLEKLEVPEGYALYVQGEISDDLYFVESGEVTVSISIMGGGKKRLRTMGAGTVIGEMGLYLGKARSASVVTESPSVIYRLSAETLSRMEKEDAELASALHRFVVRLLANRLIHANEEIALLLR